MEILVHEETVRSCGRRGILTILEAAFCLFHYEIMAEYEREIACFSAFKDINVQSTPVDDHILPAKH